MVNELRQLKENCSMIMEYNMFKTNVKEKSPEVDM
jgi:hypothetical protein